MINEISMQQEKSELNDLNVPQKQIVIFHKKKQDLNVPQKRYFFFGEPRGAQLSLSLL